MFSEEKNISSFDYIVIGAGALGLFLSNAIQMQFPNANLYIISKSYPNKPIHIFNLKNEQSIFNFLKISFFLNNKLDKIKLKNRNVIFYICLPPESIDKSFKYIDKIIEKNSTDKNIIIIFLNNGIINYNLYEELKIKYSKNYKNKFYLIRGIVISGLIREILNDKITIINTSGKKIFFKFFEENEFVNIISYLPGNYFDWIYSEDVFTIEKTKFLINFILGVYIGPQKAQNLNIFNLLPENEKNEIFMNYCSIFSDAKLTPIFLEKFFNETITTTAKNVNSVSLAWYYGNKKSIEYFISQMKRIAKLSNRKNAISFFYKLIKTKYPL